MGTLWQNCLELEHEVKLNRFPGTNVPGLRFEGSGVCLHEDSYVVVCDDRAGFIRVGPDLSLTHPANMACWYGPDQSGYEDVVWSEAAQCFYALVEADQRQPGVFQPRIDVYDRNFQPLGPTQWVDFVFENENKGLEGLAWVQHNGQEYLLGLCEGNQCRAGEVGRAPGEGRVIVLQQAGDQWKPVRKLALPQTAFFEDYAALDVRDGRALVVSQESAAVWMGALDLDQWAFVGPGTVWGLPPGPAGERLYCNVEGVAWIGPDRFVAVSDKHKADKQPASCADCECSIHMFHFPSGPR